MKHRNLATLGFATILAITTTATALADGGPYVGASVGSASLSEDFDGLDVDTDSTAFRLLAGWRFNDYFSVEVGYHRFGRFEQTLSVGGQNLDVSLKADGFTLGGTGTLPIGERFAVFGRAGSFFWDGDAEINNVTQARPEDTNLYLGIGAQFSISERFAVLADVTRYELDDTESEVASIGLTFRF